jgi:hypothetical protein
MTTKVSPSQFFHTFFAGKLKQSFPSSITNETYCIVHFQCDWSVGQVQTEPLGTTSWQPVDVVFKETFRTHEYSWPKNKEEIRLSIKLSADAEKKLGVEDVGTRDQYDFLLKSLATPHHKHGNVVRLIVPRSPGYIVRSDVVPQRLLGCRLVACTGGLPELPQFFEGTSFCIDSLQQTLSIFAISAGSIQLRSIDQTGHDTLDSLMAALDLELQNRLSYPWLSPQQPKRQTLAIVDGGLSSPENGGTGSSIYMAAKALGIDMVVFDDPGHWVNSPHYSHWRKACVPLELQLEPDPGFSDRIVEAVRSYQGHIDGILTFRDHYKLPVAEAAIQLGLPTYQPSAYEIATDKYKTSVAEGHLAFRAASFEQASSIIEKHDLKYSLIIKPCNGFLSEGVFRAQNLSEIAAGVQGINTERHGSEFVIEKYCEGPEVDANVVLCDGELILFEVSDDFPKSADANGQGDVKTFIELANVLPSKLPESEYGVLRNSLHQSLLRMGFRDGFYHIEARVENSMMEYATVDGVLDLIERVSPPRAAPASWLIEVNPRPPGIQASEAVRYTYGVDYFGLALLFALEDKDRVRRLSHTFASGPQYWCEMVFIPAEKGGVYESGDICKEILARKPELRDHVSGSFCFLNKGDKVYDPSTGINSWVGYFNVISRESREDLLRIGDVVRANVGL